MGKKQNKKGKKTQHSNKIPISVRLNLVPTNIKPVQNLNPNDTQNEKKTEIIEMIETQKPDEITTELTELYEEISEEPLNFKLLESTIIGNNKQILISDNYINNLPSTEQKIKFETANPVIIENYIVELPKLEIMPPTDDQLSYVGSCTIF